MHMHGKESKKPEIQYFATDSCGTQSITIREHAFDYLYSIQAGPFFFFFQANRNSLVAEHPEKSVEEISSVRRPHCESVSVDVYVLLADAWRQMGKFTY